MLKSLTRTAIVLLAIIYSTNQVNAQEIIPFDTTYWEIQSSSYIVENYKGYNSVYMLGGLLLKDTKFLNGTIELDLFLTERQGFPGITFRITEDNHAEQFYVRPHLPGKPDANQATPVVNGLTGWQLYFGESYSVPYEYKYDDWTHIKLVVNGSRAQVFFDYSETPHLSWNLKQPPREGAIQIGGGGSAPMHYANFRVNKNEARLVDFEVPTVDKVEGVIDEWTVSDSFEENLLDLDKLDNLSRLIRDRKWNNKVEIEENSAANLSWVTPRDRAKNTVFAKINVRSDRDQVKLFEFGYSDRAVAIVNGLPLYKGNNGWRSRDYRYLGTIGLFDSIYVNLKRGDNEILIAVSETFGGWGVMGRFTDYDGIEIR